MRTAPNVKDSEVLKVSKWDSLSCQYKRRILIFMQKYKLESMPTSFDMLFESKTERHSSRLNHTLRIPGYRTEIGRNSISFRGPVLWNSLSKEMKNSTIEPFKKHLKYEREKINAISFTKGTGQFLKKDSDYIYF